MNTLRLFTSVNKMSNNIKRSIKYTWNNNPLCYIYIPTLVTKVTSRWQTSPLDSTYLAPMYVINTYITNKQINLKPTLVLLNTFAIMSVVPPCKNVDDELTYSYNQCH